MTDTTRPEGAYEAVVYFHGMGDQRRYAELGRIIDAFDQFAQEGRRPEEPTGTIRSLRGRFDEPRAEQEELAVGHAELQSVRADGGRFRLYEAYWAPEAAKGVPVREVVGWLGKNLLRPMRILFSNWRDHPRLRHTLLDGTIVDDDVREALADLYWEFSGAVARRSFPKGSFRQFRDHLKAASRGDDWDDSVNANSLARSARQWQRATLSRSVLYQAILLSLALAVGLILLAATLGVLGVLRILGSQTSAGDIFGDLLEPSLANAWSIALVVILAVGLERFLSRSLGDVVFWATEETEERHEVHSKMLEVGIRTLRQVIEDERCTRVVVIAHSLGTPVAYESLLELGRYNKAMNREDPGGGPLPVEKLDQFITLGSPIDKLHFFFESHTGGGYAYSRLLDELRGDIAAVPFSRNRKPHIHWINIWDKADVISGPLNSPNPRVRRGSVRPVNNVEVASTLLPDPAASHSGYFGDSHVVELMFDSVFLRKYTYANTPTMGEGHPFPDRPDYDSQVAADISSSALTRLFQTVTLVLPWFVGFIWLSAAVNWESSVIDYVRGTTFLVATLLGLSLILGRFAGLRRPLIAPAEPEAKG